jgi:hypothetical protein
MKVRRKGQSSPKRAEINTIHYFLFESASLTVDCSTKFSVAIQAFPELNDTDFAGIRARYWYGSGIFEVVEEENRSLAKSITRKLDQIWGTRELTGPTYYSVLSLSLPQPTMSSTFFTWLRSPAAREYFFSAYAPSFSSS